MKINELDNILDEGMWDNIKNAGKSFATGAKNAASKIGSAFQQMPPPAKKKKNKNKKQQAAPAAKPAADLIEPWIRFLKSNRFVELKSDPSTGALIYKKKVTDKDVKRFLSTSTRYSEEEVAAAMASIGSGTPPAPTPAPQGQSMEVDPNAAGNKLAKGQADRQQAMQQMDATKQSNAAAVDQDAKIKAAADAAKAKPAFQQTASDKLAIKAAQDKGIKEAITDTPGKELSEDDVEAIFAALSNPKPVANTQQGKKNAAGAMNQMANQLSGKKPNTMANAPVSARHTASPPPVPTTESIYRRANVRDAARYIVSENIDESVDLHSVLQADQYLKLLRHIKTHVNSDINVTRIKNQVIQSWKKGMTSRKHYGGLLNQINLNINDLIGK